ncbi:MAG: hypothetical protein JWN44_779 [Myxococcales bacterium]|nr:hypothetical protein [Myxococcales bacterium]
MTKLLTAVALLSFGTAYAQSGKTDKPAAAPSGAAATPSGASAAAEPMMPPKPGPETEALKPFAHNIVSTGTVMAGAMGNNPEMATKGKATCHWAVGNLWVMCDIEEVTGTGKTAFKWMGHWMFGYDVMAKGYRGVMLDNMGMMAPMKGTLDGSKLTWESMNEMKGGPPGMPTKMRFAMDATDAKNIKFTEDGWVGGKWVTRGTGVHKVVGK